MTYEEFLDDIGRRRYIDMHSGGVEFGGKHSSPESARGLFNSGTMCPVCGALAVYDSSIPEDIFCLRTGKWADGENHKGMGPAARARCRPMTDAEIQQIQEKAKGTR